MNKTRVREETAIKIPAKFSNALIGIFFLPFVYIKCPGSLKPPKNCLIKL